MVCVDLSTYFLFRWNSGREAFSSGIRKYRDFRDEMGKSRTLEYVTFWRASVFAAERYAKGQQGSSTQLGCITPVSTAIN